MRVYRCITAREILNVYKGEIEREAVVNGENTHIYQPGVNYIHFFKYSQAAEYYLKRCGFQMNHLDTYIAYMVANIPNEVLKKYIGYGFYNYNENPLLNEMIPFPEYAIPESEFKKEYIVAIDSIIPYEYISDEQQYKNYLLCIKNLLEKYDNCYTVARKLKEINLEELLGIKDDDRTEKQILDDKLKELKKVWVYYD